MADIVDLPGIANVTRKLGDKLSIKWILKDANGVDIVFPAGTWAAQWRKSPHAPSAIPFDVAIDGGMPRISMTPAVQRTCVPLVGVWDLQFTPTGGDPTTYLMGTWTWQEDVTK